MKNPFHGKKLHHFIISGCGLCDIWKFGIFITKEISSHFMRNIRRPDLRAVVFAVSGNLDFLFLEISSHFLWKKCSRARSAKFTFIMSVLLNYFTHADPIFKYVIRDIILCWCFRKTNYLCDYNGSCVIVCICSHHQGFPLLEYCGNTTELVILYYQV